MKTCIRKVSEGIDILTGRSGLSGDADFLRLKIKELDSSNKRLTAENSELKVENINMLTRMNRSERREVAFELGNNNSVDDLRRNHSKNDYEKSKGYKNSNHNNTRVD